MDASSGEINEYGVGTTKLMRSEVTFAKVYDLVYAINQSLNRSNRHEKAITSVY